MLAEAQLGCAAVAVAAVVAVAVEVAAAVVAVVAVAVEVAAAVVAVPVARLGVPWVQQERGWRRTGAPRPGGCRRTLRNT